MQQKLTLPLDMVANLCLRFGVVELSIFGSAVRDDFGAESDVDFLADFENNDYGPWMGKLTGLQEALTSLLGRKADVVPKRMLKSTIRDQVLASARVVYAAR